MSLSPADHKKALDWYDSLKERVAVHVLTSDIVSPVAKCRDKRESPRWYEKDLKAGSRLIVTYCAPDFDYRYQFEKRLANATKLEDAQLLSHVLVRKANNSSEMRWLTVQSPASETLEFRFDCDHTTLWEGMNRREKAYATAFRDMAHLLLRYMSQHPVEDLDAMFAAMQYPCGSHRLAERLVAMGKVTLEDIRHAMDDSKFPNEAEE